MIAASIVAVVGGIIADLTDWLHSVGSDWWFLLVILVLAFFDAFFPVVPSETAVIIGGVVAGTSDDQRLWLVVLFAAIGAFLGDNFSYTIGHRFSFWVHRRAATRPRLAKRLEWAGKQIRVRGGPLLITARFIPGGRTALTMTSGLTHQPRPWFAGWIGLAALIWATYAATLGFVAGDRFQDDHTAAFLVAFGAAVAITLLIELVRHLRNRRNHRLEPQGADHGDQVAEHAEA